MLFGAIGFSYDNMGPSRQAFARSGLHSANLGDNMQTLAVRHLYQQLGVPPEMVVRIDRDCMRTYAGPPVVLPMNAVFHRNCFPLAPQITPLWIGFHANEETITQHKDWLGQQGLIGCRDPATAEVLRSHGIAADVTGCLTFAFPRRRAAPPPEKGRVIVVYGQGSGALPGAALAAMPKDLLTGAEFVLQRREMNLWPLGLAEMDSNERIAGTILHRLRKRASLVVTPLHHAAAPAIAMGIPTVVVRREASTRFGFMETLLPVHVGPDFANVDWQPAPVDLARVNSAQLDRFSALLLPWLSRPVA
jgi:hypothetical protein